LNLPLLFLDREAVRSIKVSAELAPPAARAAPSTVRAGRSAPAPCCGTPALTPSKQELIAASTAHPRVLLDWTADLGLGLGVGLLAQLQSLGQRRGNASTASTFRRQSREAAPHTHPAHRACPCVGNRCPAEPSPPQRFESSLEVEYEGRMGFEKVIWRSRQPVDQRMGNPRGYLPVQLGAVFAGGLVPRALCTAATSGMQPDRWPVGGCSSRG